jgi:hypothetical protein
LVTEVDLKPPPPETLEEIAVASFALIDFMATSSFLVVVVVGVARFLYSPDFPSFPS